MAKLYIISSVLAYSIVGGCTETTREANTAFLRAEDMFVKSGLRSTDSATYVLWSSHSCGGCRDISMDLVLQHSFSHPVKIISPKAHSLVLTKSLDESRFYIDETNVFGKKYIGIDNIGIIKTASGKVYFIKNYNPDEMAEFKTDIRR